MKKSNLHRLLAAGAVVFAFSATTYVAKADYQSTILADAPAGYWRLGEMPSTLADPYQVTNRGTLGTAADGVFVGYVGREEPGALTGSTDTAMRFWGNVAELSRVTVGSAPNFNFTGDGTAMPFTIEVWAKPMMFPSGTQRMISNGQAGQGYGFSLYGADRLRMTAFGVVDATSDFMAAPFASNQWYHLVVVRSNRTVFFYVDGVQLGNSKACNNIITTANPLTFGRTASGGEPFTGMLDEAAVYAGILTPERIAAHYQAGKNNGAGYADVILADNPMGYWRLNEPKKPESTTVIANNGSIGVDANGTVFGSLNSVVGNLTSPLVGDANTAMSFAGSDGKINVPQKVELNSPSYTVECWARLDNWNNAHQSPVTSRNSGAGPLQGFILYAAPFNTLPRWEFWNGTGTAWHTMSSGVADVVMNQWTHVVGTYDASTGVKLLYVDGKIAGGAVGVAHAPNLATPLRIGAGSSELNLGQYFWNGGVDEVAVYPTVLTPAQIQAHYTAATGTGFGMTDPPLVAADPINQTNWAPNAVTLSCVIKGSFPMDLQWYHTATDGVTTTQVTNGTNPTLVIDPTDPSKSGSYFLTATNALGTVASLPAWVEIIPAAAPEFVLNAPASVPVYAGGTAGIPVLATNTPPITYQWQSNTVDIASATNSLLTVAGVQPSYATAMFRAKASNPVSTVTSDPAQLNVLTPPATTYAAVTIGFNPLAYWRLGEPSGAVAFDYWGGHPALYVNAAQGMSPGALLDNDDGAVTVYDGAYVRTLEAGPFNFTGTKDFTLSAFVKASEFPATGAAARVFSTGLGVGYGFGFLGNTILRFTGYGVKDVNVSVPKFEAEQWYHIAAVRSNYMVYLYIDGKLMNQDTLADIRASTYPLQLGGNPSALISEAFKGMIDEAAVFNRALTSTEIAALYVGRYGALNPPTITRQPSPATLFVGGTARFGVQATGSQPMGYQWKANGTAIPGATNANLVVTGVTLANNGVNYSVTINNQAGTLTSDNALLTVLQPNNYAAAVVADNPVGLWRLGEQFGPVAYDNWGSFNGHDNGSSPVLFGTAGALLNDANTAATFDGTASRLEVPYAAALNPPVYSVEAWAKVKGGAGTYRAVVSARDEQAGVYQKGFIIYATSANIWSFWTSPGAGWEALNGPPVVLDEWTHLVAVYDGQSKHFYVNGTLVASQATISVPNDLRPIRFGEGRNEFDPGDYRFNGDIDEVAIYNTVLSADRVAYHYNLGKYSTTTSPFFVTKPVSLNAVAGQNVTLISLAGGSPALSYQWTKDGVAIPGATAPNLALTGASYSDSGIYSVTAANSIGSTNSGNVQVAITTTPLFANATNGLVLHLKFENNYTDSSGRGNIGTAVGSPSFVPGKVGTSALHYFTDLNAGQYNYVTLGTPADLQFGSDVNFSVSYWVKFTGSPADLPFLCSAVNSYGGWGITFAPSYNQGGWSWSLGNGTGYVGVYGTANSINNGEWHHLVHTFDRAGTAITYLNGIQVDTRSVAAGGNVDSGAQFNIGQDPTGFYPENGAADIDDLAVWRRVLSSYETLGIYNAGQAGRSLDAYGPVQIAIEATADGLHLVWQAGKLLESDNLTGPYTPVEGAVAPFHKVTLSAGSKFYRVEL